MNIKSEDTNINEYISLVRALNSNKNPKLYSLTLGCQQNEADSEKIRSMAMKMGYSLTESPDDADFIVVNTCAIREHAELKALSIIGKFKALKKDKPDLIIGVCGCMSAEKHRVELIKKSYPYVSFTLEPALIHKIPELVYTFLTDGKRSFIYGMDKGDAVEGLGNSRKSDFSAWVSIMYGCNNFCSYCIVPYVRGRERSRNSTDVINECKELVLNGYKEITLLGQNVNSYKSDIDFATLLERVASIEGDFIIRFMTSHPKDVPDRLIEVMAKHRDKIAPVFHLPIQSGSDCVLKRMNRTYTSEKYLNTVSKIREAIPDISLTSDIIVGFPGESDEDFEQTLNILNTVRFDMVYSFIYSKRVGTKAASFEDQVPEEIKGIRMRRLLEMQDEISHEKNLPYIGRCERVLVDSKSKRGEDNIYTGRTFSNKLVHFKSDTNSIGKFVNIKITSAGAFDLFGEEI